MPTVTQGAAALCPGLDSRRAFSPPPTPDQILALKICDLAVGSAAFLVETCRQLAEELLKAWRHHGGRPSIPPDETEELFAMRLARERYAAHYSTSRLRELASRIKGSRHGDLWRQFQLLVGALSGDPRFTATRDALAPRPLGSMLWNPASGLQSDTTLANSAWETIVTSSRPTPPGCRFTRAG